MQRTLSLEELDQQAIWSRKDMLRYFRIGNDTLLSWIEKGLPCYRIKSRMMFQRSDVMKFVNKHRVAI